MLHSFPNVHIISTPFTGVIPEILTFLTKKFTSVVLLSKPQRTDIVGLRTKFVWWLSQILQ